MIRLIIAGVILIYVWNVMPDLIKQAKQTREDKMAQIWSDCCSTSGPAPGSFKKCLEGKLREENSWRAWIVRKYHEAD